MGALALLLAIGVTALTLIAVFGVVRGQRAFRWVASLLAVGVALSLTSTFYTRYVGWDAFGWTVFIAQDVVSLAFWATLVFGLRSRRRAMRRDLRGSGELDGH
jgi:hypothetical protein